MKRTTVIKVVGVLLRGAFKAERMIESLARNHLLVLRWKLYDQAIQPLEEYLEELESIERAQQQADAVSEVVAKMVRDKDIWNDN